MDKLVLSLVVSFRLIILVSFAEMGRLHDAAARGRIGDLRYYISLGDDLNVRRADKKGWLFVIFERGLGTGFKLMI